MVACVDKYGLTTIIISEWQNTMEFDGKELVERWEDAVKQEPVIAHVPQFAFAAGCGYGAAMKYRELELDRQNAYLEGYAKGYEAAKEDSNDG
jgi:hypothetical protein